MKLLEQKIPHTSCTDFVGAKCLQLSVPTRPSSYWFPVILIDIAVSVGTISSEPHSTFLRFLFNKFIKIASLK